MIAPRLLPASPFCQVIYASVLKFGKNETNKVHYNNSDVAYRVVAYAQTNIAVDDIKAAYEKDNLLAIHYLMDNLHIWKNKEKRNAFNIICSQIHSKIIHDSYDIKEYELQEKYPDWFKDKDQLEDEMPATVGKLKSIIQEYNDHQSVEIFSEIRKLTKETNNNSKSIKWLFVVYILFIAFEIFSRN